MGFDGAVPPPHGGGGDPVGIVLFSLNLGFRIVGKLTLGGRKWVKLTA